MSEILFKVYNDRVEVVNPPTLLANGLHEYLSYPSQIAILRAQNIELPDDDINPGWDGIHRLYHRNKRDPDWFPTGLLDLAWWVSGQLGLCSYIRIQDMREKPLGDVPPLIDIPLRDYQQEAVNVAVAEGRGVLDMPPRSGKTRTMVEIARRLAVPMVWLAPTHRIAAQTVGVIDQWFGPNYGHHLVGATCWGDYQSSRLVVCTAATAKELPQEFYQTREALIVDEFHHAAADSYNEIFGRCPHVYYRLGMTGTFFRSGADDLALYAKLSRTLFKIKSDELMRRGYLVPVHVAFLPSQFQSLSGIRGGWTGGYGKHGIHEHENRNLLVSYTANFLLQTGRTVLILVGTKKQGKMILEMLSGLSPAREPNTSLNPIEFISTDMKRDRQKEVLDSFEERGAVKVLIGTTILGEGVDMPSADALVLARGEKAEVSLVQAMYRICTAHPGKTNAILVDFADRHHHKLLDHSASRLRIYGKDPIFDVSVMNDAQEFPQWLSQRQAG